MPQNTCAGRATVGGLFLGDDAMLRGAIIGACLVAAFSGGFSPTAAEGGFALRSRSLIEGPARTIRAFGDGFVLGTGGAVAVLRGTAGQPEPAYLPIEGEPRDLLVRGVVVYVASTAGLHVIDCTDPARPVETHHCDIAHAMQCAVAGEVLFVADERGGIHSFTLENPREPGFNKTTLLSCPIISMPAEKDIIAAAHAGTIEIFRADSSGSLHRLSVITTPGNLKKAILANAVLCALTAGGEVLAWDVAHPEDPQPQSGFRQRDIIDISAEGRAGAMLGAARMIVPFEIVRNDGGRPAAGNIRLKRAIGLPVRPSAAAGTAPTDIVTTRSEATAVFTIGERIATISPFGGVSFFALERGALRSIGFFPTRGFATGIVAAQDLLYLANGSDGVRIGHVGDAGAIDWISHVQTEDARDVFADGEFLFIADGSGGLRIAEISDPANPRLIARHASPYYMSALVVRDGRAYCAGGLGGVEIVDVSDPRRPRLAWRRAFSEVRGIDVDDRYCYIADGDAGLRIFALDNLEPQLVSTLDTPGWNCDVSVVKDRAYLADGGHGIRVAEISDRERPSVIGAAPTGAVARNVYLRGAVLFVAAFTRGVVAFDVSTPEHPAELHRFQTVNDARAIHADDRFVYVASGAGGVYVFSYER
jgi:hypothetical protein